MKLPLLKATFCSTAMLLAGVALPVHAVPVLNLEPVAAAVQAGDLFVLLLRGSGFDLTAGGLTIQNISGGQGLNLGFSAGTLELTAVSIDPRWTFAAANKPGVIDNAAGTLTGLAFGTFPSTADASFDIARLTFHALQALPASVVVTAAAIVGRVNNVAGSTITPNFVASNVAISAVSEPAVWALLPVGIGCLVLRRRRA